MLSVKVCFYQNRIKNKSETNLLKLSFLVFFSLYFLSGSNCDLVKEKKMFEINNFKICKTSHIMMEPFESQKNFKNVQRTKLCPITTYTHSVTRTTFLTVGSILGFFKLFNPDHPFPLFYTILLDIFYSYFY